MIASIRRDGRPPVDTTGPTAITEREERLLRLLERGSGSGRFQLGEKWLFAAGGALALVGVALILAGWAGASQTVLVAGQIPYLISGGLLGLGLIFLGSFLYFGRWLAVVARETRERGADQGDELAAIRRELEQLRLAVASGRGGGLPGDSGGSQGVPAAGSATEPILVATPAGSMAHRPECRAVAGRTDLRTVSAGDGVKLCGMCRPWETAGPEAG